MLHHTLLFLLSLLLLLLLLPDLCGLCVCVAPFPPAHTPHTPRTHPAPPTSNLRGNQLSGPIPAPMWTFVHPSSIDFSSNLLTGLLPEQMVTLAPSLSSL